VIQDYALGTNSQGYIVDDKTIGEIGNNNRAYCLELAEIHADVHPECLKWRELQFSNH